MVVAIIGRLLTLLRPAAFQKCFHQWILVNIQAAEPFFIPIPCSVIFLQILYTGQQGKTWGF
jgi:hypothetical protein